MSSSLQNYHEDQYDKWVKSDERIEGVARFKKSYKYKRFHELRELFKEWEEYQNLKEQIKIQNRRLCYDFVNNIDNDGIIKE